MTHRAPFCSAHLPVWAQVGHNAGIVAMKRLDYLCLVTLSLATLGNVVLRPSLNGLDGTLPSERVLAYFATAHLAIGSKWIVSQACLGLSCDLCLAHTRSRRCRRA